MRSLVSWVIPQRHSQEPKCLACVGFHVVLGVEAPNVFESGESAVVPDRVLTKSGHHRVDAFHVALCVVGWLVDHLCLYGPIHICLYFIFLVSVRTLNEHNRFLRLWFLLFVVQLGKPAAELHLVAVEHSPLVP